MTKSANLNSVFISEPLSIRRGYPLGRINWGPTITTIILGVDGATFDLFKDWLDDLPNIQHVIESGVGTSLQSSVPPVTSPAWRCYATGKDPSKLGVYWWRQLERESGEYIGAPNIPLRSKCYWEYLSDEGKEVCVIGVPLNTPPREVNGTLILGGPYADSDEYTYPSNLKESIEERFDYKLHPDTDPASATEPTDPEIVRELEKMINQRFDVAEWLQKRDGPELLNITLFYINHLQHTAWDADEVKGLWELIDKRLGEITGEDDDIIIHSDHGLHEVESVFYLNSWLEENGYLQLREDENQNKSLKRMIWTTGREATEKLGVKDFLSYCLPRSVKSKVSVDDNGRIVDQSDYESRIDFEESDAVGLPHGLVYDLTGGRIADELRSDLESLTHPKTSDLLFSKVHSLDEVYSLSDINTPDFFLEWESGIEIKDVHNEDPDRIFGPPQQFQADNHPEGILLASGPNISSDGDVTSARLYDLAPTILHLLGCPIPDDIDGNVLKELYSCESNASSNEVRTITGEEFSDTKNQGDEQVQNRLRDLGYIE